MAPCLALCGAGDSAQGFVNVVNVNVPAEPHPPKSLFFCPEKVIDP